LPMLLLSALLFAAVQPPVDSFATVRGRVTDAATAQAVAEVAVTIEGSRLGALTDAQGRYEIRRVPAGTVTVVAGRIGYATLRRSLELAAGDVRTLDLALAAAGATLSAVTVEARTTEREQFTLSADPGLFAVRGETLRRVPVIGEPDVLRVVQLMPGVVATNDFNAGYNVRGGESDQNLVLLDGYPIYNPFHLAGLFGTFIDETVGEFELLPGGLPARYGTRLSSVLTITPRAEERAGVHGTLAASVLATSLSLGGRAGGRTSWNVAARRTYADRFVALLSSSSLPYWFTDAQAHVRHELAGGGRLSLTAYAGEDVLAGFFSGLGDSTSAGNGALRFDWGNTLLGAAWEQPLARLAGGDSARLMQRLSRTGFRTTLDLGGGSLTLANRLAESRAWGEATRWSGPHETRLGYEWSAYHVTYDVEAPAAGGAPLLARRQAPSAGAVYLDQTWRAERISARAGLRAETVTGTGWAALSPRASLKWFANPDLALTLSAGRTTQWTPALRNEQAPVRLFDFWLTADRNTPVASAWQFIGGAERWLGARRFVRVEGYHKHYDRLPSSNLFNDPSVLGDEFIVTTGTSSGVDVLWRELEGARWSGWVAYSFGVNWRTGGLRADGGRDRFAPVQDRRHNLNVVASYDPGGRWRYGLRLGLGSGTPFTDVVGQVVRRRYDPVTNSFPIVEGDVEREPLGGPRNGVRFPLFQRLDLSATRTSTGTRTWAPYVSIINAYNARNVFTYVFDYTRNPPERSAVSQFPLLPTVGVSVSW
jgi:hypothetical protein